jgi:hypothetical protein
MIARKRSVAGSEPAWNVDELVQIQDDPAGLQNKMM